MQMIPICHRPLLIVVAIMVLNDLLFYENLPKLDLIILSVSYKV